MISFQNGYFINTLKENVYFPYPVHGKIEWLKLRT